MTRAERIASLLGGEHAAIDYLSTHPTVTIQIDPARPGASIGEAIAAMPPEGGLLIVEGEGSHRCGTIRLRAGVYALVEPELVRTVNPLFLAEGIDQFGLDARIDLAGYGNNGDGTGDKGFDTAIKIEDCYDWVVGSGTEIRNSGPENKEWTQHGVLARGGARGNIPHIKTQGCQVKIGGGTGGTDDTAIGTIEATRPMQYALSIVTRGPQVLSNVRVALVDVTDPFCAGRSVFLGYDEDTAPEGSEMRRVAITKIRVRGTLGVGEGTAGNVVNIRPCAVSDDVWIGEIDIEGVKIEPKTTRFALFVGDKSESTRPSRLTNFVVNFIKIVRVDRSVLIRGDVFGTLKDVYGRQTRAISVPATVLVEKVDIA